MKTKTKLIFSAIAVLLFTFLPIKPLLLGCVLSGTSGFLTGWFLVSYIKEKSEENDKNSIQ